MKLRLRKILPSLIIGLVFVQASFFKFSGSNETEFIFQTLAVWSGLKWFGDGGAYLIGSAELLAAILLFSRWHALGALISVAIMSGAIFFHLFTPLGIEMPVFNEVGEVIGNDGGGLFSLACLVWLCGVYLTIRDWRSSESSLKKMLWGI